MSASRLLVLPKLGLTMTEGAVVEWTIAPGSRFAAGDTLFVVESDKAAVEFDAPADGVLHQILVPVGTTVAVGTEIGTWSLDGDTGDAATAAATVGTTPQVAVPAAAASAQAPHPAALPGPPAGASTRIIATPLARRRAAAAGVDLASVTPSGPRGRVVAADVEAAAMRPAEAVKPSAAAAAGSASPSAGTIAPLTPSQRTMATRVTASKRDIPHFYLSLGVEVSELLQLRKSLTELPGRPRTTVTHLLVAAVVEALRRTPGMNRIWTEQGLVSLPTLDVGLAVDTPSGLMSPVVHDLAGQSFFDLVRSVDAVIERARNASLRGADVQGGAITISNAGMHDVHYMSSIIVPGQSAILGVGAVQPCFRPDDGGRPALRRELGLVLSADHRIHTGVAALGFLNTLKSILQRPLALLAGA